MHGDTLYFVTLQETKTRQMREILFRGKRVDNGEWVYGDLIHGVGWKKGKTYILPEIINQPGCHHLDGFEVIPESVGQFTGLLDKNGVKIFEGDICVLHSEFAGTEYYGGDDAFSLKYTGVVHYAPSMGYHLKVLKCHDLDQGCEVAFSRRKSIAQYRTERIGNIHDNPDLLKESDS